MENKHEVEILVVDDEEDMLETCRKLLTLKSYNVEVSAHPLRALERCRRKTFDVIIVDLKMPELDGLQLMKEIHKINRDQMVLMITAYASAENAITAVRLGAFDFVRKPFKMDDLVLVVERALRFKALQDENARLQRQIGEAFQSDRIVGKSPVLQDALVKVRKVSEVDVPVLIWGESGTGKELFARTIHENSVRRGKAFLAIDCASLPEQLLESELFGYERGAFTGAVQAKKGLLEMGSGGTVLFDEIGEMDLNLQAKLLRALQEGVVRPLGSSQERKIDVRVISATHCNLPEMVEAGSFRGDLFYRLNVVTIEVPPLRARGMDIPILAQYFFDRFREKMVKKLEGISAAALVVLEEYDWPGNVRELRNVVERACTLTDATQISPQDLPPRVLAAAELHQPDTHGTFLKAKRTVVEDFERRYLSELLLKTAGNVTEAAKAAGLSRPALHRLLAKFGLSSTSFKGD